MIGYWLLARLATHWAYNRSFARRYQEPLDCGFLRRCDELAIARLELDLAVARSGGPRQEVA